MEATVARLVARGEGSDPRAAAVLLCKAVANASNSQLQKLWQQLPDFIRPQHACPSLTSFSQ